MAKFVLISGGQAVGKITGLKLSHNHETLDLVSKFFDFDNYKEKLIEISDKFRFTLFEKVAKSDLEFSKKDLLKAASEHRINSYEGELKYKNYMRIDNTNISAKDTAKMIKEKFNL